MINDNYLNGLASLMAGSSYTIPSYMAFGSTDGVLSVTDIETSGEFDRSALSSRETSNNIVKFIGNRSSAIATNDTINICGLHQSSVLGGTGDVQVNTLVSSLVHTTNFDIEIEFWVSHVRG